MKERFGESAIEIVDNVFVMFKFGKYFLLQFY